MGHPSNAHEPDLDALFTHHPPSGDQPERYQAIRTAAKAFARTLIESCPPCADRSAALRKLREAVMVANAAMALEEAADG